MAKILTAPAPDPAPSRAPLAYTRADSLRAYLRDAATHRFRWGEADCATLVADWVRIETGRDGAATLRGLYRCADTARLVMGRAGLLGIVASCARGIGLEATREPACGDIAVLASQSGEMPHLVCGIRTARADLPTWAVRAERAGLIVTPHLAIVRAWAVPALPDRAEV